MRDLSQVLCSPVCLPSLPFLHFNLELQFQGGILDFYLPLGSTQSPEDLKR